jgi:hypothetical protein
LTVDFDQLEYFAEKAFPLMCKYMKLKKLWNSQKIDRNIHKWKRNIRK